MNNELAEKLEALTTEIDRMMAGTHGGKVTCEKGCSACCYEAVYVARGEAQLIVDRVRMDGPAAVDALRKRVNTWMRRFWLTDLWDSDMPPIVQYRSLRLKCPLLADDGSCSVYAVRPMGCRMHMTKAPKRGCEDLTQRGRAKFVDVMGTATEFGHTNVLFAMNEALIASHNEGSETVTMDHLVVLLADALGMSAPPSGSRQSYASPSERAVT